MREIDKAGLGERIRQIRRAAGLRQWELARRLGTTQSAVHKYERGVVPEPKRLMEIARLGNTSIEWILSGRHGEDGSEERERPAPELIRTARMLREIDPAVLPSVAVALRILRDAAAALDAHPVSGDAAARDDRLDSLRFHAPAAVRVLEAAWEIQNAVLARLARDAGERLAGSPLVAKARSENDPGGTDPEGTGERRAE